MPTREMSFIPIEPLSVETSRCVEWVLTDNGRTDGRTDRRTDNPKTQCISRLSLVTAAAKNQGPSHWTPILNKRDAPTASNVQLPPLRSSIFPVAKGRTVATILCRRQTIATPLTVLLTKVLRLLSHKHQKCREAVASLRLVSPGAVWWGVTLFLPPKSDDLFLVVVPSPSPLFPGNQ